MKKKIVSLILVSAVMTSMLCGCGSTDTPATEEVSQTETTQQETQETQETGSTDAIANLIAATEGPVDLTVWCSETEAYQKAVAELVEDFKAEYSDVEFNITIGAESEANCKDDVLADVEAAADLFVFPDDQLLELVNAGALQSVDATFTYDPHKTNAGTTVEAASVDGTLYAYPLTASNGYFLFYDKNALTEEDVSSWDNLWLLPKSRERRLAWRFPVHGISMDFLREQDLTCIWAMMGRISVTGMPKIQSTQGRMWQRRSRKSVKILPWSIVSMRMRRHLH